MRSPRRIVIDPNVLISAAVSKGGVTAAILDLVDAQLLVPVVSPMLLGELSGVLRRRKFRRWLDEGEVAAFIDEIQRLSEVHDDPEAAPRVAHDPDDDYLFALARSADADALVSGDSDVTGVDAEDLVVLTPRDLLDVVTADIVGDGD